LIISKHFRSWGLVAKNPMYILLVLFALINLLGCATTPIRIESNPLGAKFTIFDKKGQEVKTVSSADICLFDDNNRKIISSEPVHLYDHYHADYSSLYHVWTAIPSSTPGNYTVYWTSNNSIFSNQILNLYSHAGYKQSGNVTALDTSGRRQIKMVLSAESDNITPKSILWGSNYDYVKFELAGFPSNTAKRQKISDGSGDSATGQMSKIVSIDFTKAESSNALEQGVTSSSIRIVAQSNEPSIEQTVSKAIQNATQRVPKNSVFAVVPITATENVFRNFVTSESEYCLVGQGFSVVDRAQLDRIRTEQRLQMSGEIDANTISSIGRFSGADYILTGRIDGSESLQRLRFQVIEVQTSDIIWTASEQFGASQPIANPVGINEALQKAIEDATAKVSQDSRLAIVDVVTGDNVIAFLTGEAEYILKEKGYRVVDRAQLDRVRTEQMMQQSIEFDDKIVANIGKLAGADYLITIRIDGIGVLTRMRWRILNTQTALVAGVASVHFDSDIFPSTSPLTLDNARKSALELAIVRVTKDARLAIVQFNSADSAVRGENVVYSLENDLVNSGFRVVDRSQLDTIRAEQRYQRSGEVDSRTAVDIGKFAGARYIVTGSIDGVGSLRRFRLRVLDTETAEVVGVASVSY